MIEDQLREFVLTELHWDGARQELTDDLPLIGNQIVDSLGILRIVSFVESEFGVEVLDEELVPEHFGTIAGIAELIRSKRSS
jgi:acyl carrier protein